MSDMSVEFVLTGNCGPNAYRTLSTAGIGVVVGCKGTVSDVARRFAEGELEPSAEANVESHFGQG
jgi:predicted Fe-Mo cluster-binding NifX family protein